MFSGLPVGSSSNTVSANVKRRPPFLNSALALALALAPTEQVLLKGPKLKELPTHFFITLLIKLLIKLLLLSLLLHTHWSRFLIFSILGSLENVVIIYYFYFDPNYIRACFHLLWKGLIWPRPFR